MKDVKEFLSGIAQDNEIKTNNSKIEQRTRNLLRNQFTDLMTKALQELLESDEISVVRTKEGIGIALDNRKVGFIPIVLKPVFKDTAEDLFELAEDYEQELKDKAERLAKQQKAKEKKIAQTKKSK